jgi:hypothetical protein
MSLFAISDLHLALSVPDKPMDIFGGWDDYMVRIEKNWNNLVTDDDTVVVPGDISWALKLDETYKDLDFLNSLKGQKVLLKGNHDYWWATRAKIEKYLLENKFDTLHIVFNDHYNYGEEYAICGTRGWVYMPGEKNDEKIQAREAGRLESSILSALKENRKPVVFLHYPPIFGDSFNENILEVLSKYNIDKCYYGHIHGNSGHRNAFQGEFNGTIYRMISCDYLQFYPYKIL